jgi:hypothetical protein
MHVVLGFDWDGKARNGAQADRHRIDTSVTRAEHLVAHKTNQGAAATVPLSSCPDDAGGQRVDTVVTQGEGLVERSDLFLQARLLSGQPVNALLASLNLTGQHGALVQQPAEVGWSALGENGCMILGHDCCS